jgi:hypothetical protein
LTQISAKPFQDDGRTAVHGLRRALAGVLASVGADADQPQEISRKYGLDKTLTWRISRVVREEDVWEAVQHIPRRPSMRIFARAMAKHGAAEESVESLWKAVEEFERFIETHSGDRETLEMMASPAGRRSAARRMENFRKAGYQAGAAVWGVCTRTQIKVHFVAPSKVKDRLDVSIISALVDFKRLRADVPWAVGFMSQWDVNEGFGTDLAPWEAVDRSVAPGDIPLMQEFCSDPLPIIEKTQLRPGLVRYMLTKGPVGSTAASTIVLGWRYPAAVSVHQSYPGETGEYRVDLTTPAQGAINDVYIHRDLKFALNPTAHVYSALPGGAQYNEGAGNAVTLPVPCEVVDLGTPPQTVTPELQAFGEIVSATAKQAGHSLADFLGYRHRLTYPPIPCIAVLRHALLPKP